MRAKSEDTLRRWLDAERDDDAEAAEAALAALFAQLPAAAPPLGFAARVASLCVGGAPAGLGAAASARARGPLATLWGRLLLGLALAGAGVAAPFVPALLRELFGGLDAAALLGAVPGLVAAACGRLVGALDGLLAVVDLAGALAAPFRSPAIAAGLLGSLLLGAAAFFLLNRLIGTDRSWSHGHVHG
ncbi:MAG TPA: hypothetical protein VNJ70_14780 [Thermoanaerobaculia bacterium]|nr:hypothetical protein [Thermoanaerobaculia bacterium]